MWAASETAVIIAGASIPFLRKLLLDRLNISSTYKTSQITGTYARQRTTGSSGTHTSCRHSTIDVEAPVADAPECPKWEDSSEKIISRDRNGSASGIFITQQFSVDHAEAVRYASNGGGHYVNPTEIGVAKSE
jgi:hypothetical protein